MFQFYPSRCKEQPIVAELSGYFRIPIVLIVADKRSVCFPGKMPSDLMVSPAGKRFSSQNLETVKHGSSRVPSVTYVFGFTSTRVKYPSYACKDRAYLTARQIVTACCPSSGESIICQVPLSIGSTSTPRSYASCDEILLALSSCGIPLITAMYVF